MRGASYEEHNLVGGGFPASDLAVSTGVVVKMYTSVGGTILLTLPARPERKASHCPGGGDDVLLAGVSVGALLIGRVGGARLTAEESR